MSKRFSIEFFRAFERSSNSRASLERPDAPFHIAMLNRECYHADNECTDTRTVTALLPASSPALADVRMPA